MRTFVVSATAALLAASMGCEPDRSSGAAAPPSTPVASVDLGAGQRFEMYETAGGELLYSQVGPKGVAPVELPAEVKTEPDPVKVFARLAPGRAVPDTLLAAAARGARRARDIAAADSEGRGGGIASATDLTAPSLSRQPDESEIHRALGGRDVTEVGPVPGRAGCPFESFFKHMTANGGDVFCPPNTNRSWCQQSVSWGFAYHPRVARAYSVVCTEVGVAVLDVYTFDQTSAIASFWVDGGTWRYVFTNIAGRNNKVFKKFDMHGTGFGPSQAHFGGIFEL
jgi:hypothetical protein